MCRKVSPYSSPISLFPLARPLAPPTATAEPTAVRARCPHGRGDLLVPCVPPLHSLHGVDAVDASRCSFSAPQLRTRRRPNSAIRLAARRRHFCPSPIVLVPPLDASARARSNAAIRVQNDGLWSFSGGSRAAPPQEMAAGVAPAATLTWRRWSRPVPLTVAPCTSVDRVDHGQHGVLFPSH